MRCPAAWTAWICCLLLWHPPLYAIDSIRLQAGHWTFDNTTAKQFSLSVDLTEQGLQLSAAAEKLDLPAPIGSLHNLQLACSSFKLNAGRWQCESGTAAFRHQQLGEQDFRFSIKAGTDKNDYQLTLNGLKLAESRISLEADVTDSAWTVSVSADRVSLTALRDFLPLMLSESQLALVADWDYQGQVKLEGRFEGKAGQLQAFSLNWQASDLSFSNVSGTQVAESVALNGQTNGRLQQAQWHWQLELGSNKGQAYSEPIFLDLKQYPLSLTASGQLATDFKSFKVEQARLEQGQVLAANATLNWQNQQIQSLHIVTGPADLSKLYPIWLQPFVAGSAAAKLETSGRLSMTFDWQQSDYQLLLDFNEAMLSDKEGRYSLQNLNGQLGWSQTDQSLNSSLAWRSAKLFEIELGAAAIQAHSANNRLVLDESLRLPVLDGSLEISNFSLDNQSGRLQWQFAGLLTPISMQRLTSALDWPPLEGKLSGVIPTVTYQDEEMKIDGALQVKVFDGTTIIRDLRMTTPFGRLPQLYANVDIHNLDLALLTNAFDFGRITGKIEGHVHHLRLSNWEPVRFDARLATPQENPGKRRISQRAVDNLTELGGGPTGMVSRSFLGFFDDFSYQKMGLSCELDNEVCEMAGIEEAEQGYYIVKGGGGLPPWINVIGYNRRVDWSELIARLLAIRESPGPVIE
ncbi:hypothetical protein [Methylophaga sp.]|uniref:hypothetical protein n=1 Tax=Methylophaga sp. TaxID=2024840 RepID=UPI0013FF9183|nr:hypothetical protein [Methylophaga sp.]MTI64584.1 hypothetical protein [Methylophaga sp.]